MPFFCLVPTFSSEWCRSQHVREIFDQSSMIGLRSSLQVDHWGSSLGFDQYQKAGPDGKVMTSLWAEPPSCLQPIASSQTMSCDRNTAAGLLSSELITPKLVQKATEAQGMLRERNMRKGSHEAREETTILIDDFARQIWQAEGTWM